MKKSVNRIIGFLLIFAMLTGITSFGTSSVFAIDDDISNYRFSYLSANEAKALIGFLTNKNDVEDYTQTDIYKYLIGQFSSNKEYENQVKFAFAYIAESLLNERLDETSAKMNRVIGDLIDYLQNTYGSNVESKVVENAINDELKSIRKIIWNFIVIFADVDTQEDAIEIEGFGSGFDIAMDLFKTIKDPKKKVKEYTDKINAIMNVVKFSDSIQRHEMYDQFSMYMNNARVYLNFGNTDISETIIYLNQSAHNLYNEKNIWAEYIQKAISSVDVFHLLDNYWLNWSTDDRIALMKKWAAIIVYSSRSAAENVTKGTTNYSLIDSSFVTDSGQSIAYKTREYNDKYELTKLIDIEDLQYTINDSAVTITGYLGYEGEYSCVALPEKINGYPVTRIGIRAFDDVNWQRIFIPATVTAVDDYAFYNNPSLDAIVVLGDTQIALTAFDWRMDGTNGLYADQSTGNVPVFCNYDSKARQFANSKQGFYYKSLSWDGNTIWGVYPSGKTLNIFTGNELNYISTLVNSGFDLSDCEIQLCADIDLGNKEFKPIGFTKDTVFKGSFNGNSKRIYNYLQKKDCSTVGLFGFVESEKSEFLNVQICGSSNNTYNGIRGALIGEVNVLSNGSLKLTNVNVEYSDVKDYGNDTVGGIIGKITSIGNSTIILNQCSMNGTLSRKGGSCVGGLVGHCKSTETDSVYLTKCYVKGTFSYTRPFQSGNGTVAGLLGKGERGHYYFDQCCAAGKVTCDSHTSAVGGFVSDFSPDAFEITNCESFANLIAKGSMVTVVGGFIGGLNTTYLIDSECQIKNSFVSAVLNSTFGSEGAFVSSHDDALQQKSISVENSYYDNGKKSINENFLIMSNHRQSLGGARGSKNDKWINSGVYSSSELKTNHSLYDNWDFESTWEYAESGYPKLRVFDDEACASHDYSIAVTQPTCNDQGYTTYTCVDCGYEYKGDYVSKLGHRYTETVVPPTCTAQGYTLHKCIRCNNSYKDNYTNMIEHTYKPTKVVPPTCQDVGYTIYTCENCDATVQKDFVSKLTHQDSSTISPLIVPPTCQDYGYTLHTCGLCGETYKTDYINKLEHQESIKLKTTESGYALVKYCMVGNESLSEKEVQIETYTDDDSNTWKYVVADNEAYICEFTGNEIEVNVPNETAGINVVGITESVFKNKSIVSVILPNSIRIIGANAFENCTALKSIRLPSSLTSVSQNMFYGCESLTEISIEKNVSIICDNAFFGCDSLEKVKYCSMENKWKNIVICEGNDLLDNVNIDVKDATKTYYFINNKNWYEVYAYTWYYMENGSAVNSRGWPGEEMNLVGTNDEGYEVYSIDVSSDMDYIIFNMGSNQEQTIDVLFNDYEGNNAFTLSDHMQNNHYTVNGCNYNESPFVGHSLTLGGDIGINFYADLSDEDVNNGKVKVNFAWNVEGTEKTYSVTLSPDDKCDLGYKASCPVPAAEMTYDVTATIIVNNVPLDNTDTYSAQKYAKVILNDENNFRDKYITAENKKGRNGEQRYNDLVTLVQTMLDYGTKAQVVFNRDTDHPANEGTDYFNDDVNPIYAEMITVTEENMDMDLSTYGLRYKGSTVVYLSETSIRHYYYVDDWDSFNKIKDSVSFDGAAVTYVEKDGAIYFEKKGVSAPNLDTPYTLTIKEKSCKFAVNDYIRYCLDSTKVSDNTKALVKATYRYNQAANEYFSN